jgi:Zn-dependent metalloprotease
MRLHRLATITASVAVLVVPLTGAVANAAPAPDGLRLIAQRDSLLATHQWYVQTFNGHKVIGSFYGKHTDKKTGQVSISDGRIAVNGLAASVAPLVANGQAETQAQGSVASSELAVLPGAQAKLVYDVVSDAGAGATRTLVDARTGSVVKRESLIKNVDGTGKVFSPNPVADLQAEQLTDHSDRNSAVPDVAYHTVKLTNLDGSGFLHGDFASIADPVNKQPRSASNTFNFLRADDFFESVMAYYSITEAEKYIQRLGFTDVNNRSQPIVTTGFKDDNSFYDPSNGQVTFGTGGVDDAEDSEVIWHEYGHSIQDNQVPGFGDSEEAGAIGEAFGDWWALIMSSAVQRDTAVTPLACIMDWDSTFYTSDEPHCLRRTDTDLKFGDRVGEVHFDGQIWSRALFDIFKAFGRDKAATLVLESQFSFTPMITMAQAARATVDTAKAMFGQRDAQTVQAAFHARDII